MPFTVEMICSVPLSVEMICTAPIAVEMPQVITLTVYKELSEVT